MDVPASKSVKMRAQWTMGSMYFCEHYHDSESVPSDAVVKWTDNGATMCLRPQDPVLTLEAEGWAEAGKHVSTTHNAIWHITPQTMVKVNSWQEGAQSEGRTIKFVNDRHPEIPTTRVIYEWIDHAWTRSFMIMRRARGVFMDHAMIHMTNSQVQDVANQVAVHINTLTQHTSTMLETVDHCGVKENRLVGFGPLNEAPHTPSYASRQWPRFTPEEFMAHLKHHSEMKSIPDPGSEFVLYNPDITPHSLFVYPPRPGQKGRLAEIIDWEDTAYWPRYWVATCPHPERPFLVEYNGQNDGRWPLCLRKALVKAGFESLAKWWVTFHDVSNRLRNEQASQEYRDWVATVRLENLRLQNMS